VIIIFINFSNHPSKLWSKEQYTAASEYGDIIDIQFPLIPTGATPGEIAKLARQYIKTVIKHNPKIVMCQGEFTFVFSVVTGLLSSGIPVVAACTERRVKEDIKDGKIQKTSVFEFKQFREYSSLYGDIVT
jgi:hypothetical protein